MDGEEGGGEKRRDYIYISKMTLILYIYQILTELPPQEWFKTLLSLLSQVVTGPIHLSVDLGNDYYLILPSL